MIRRFRRNLVLCVSCAGLVASGCGIKGPLVLPKSPAAGVERPAESSMPPPLPPSVTAPAKP